MLLEKRKLSSVWKKKLIKESDPAHSLGGTSQVRWNGAGMAHTQPGIGASPGASCVGTLIHADIQQQINDCARWGNFPLSSTSWVWWVWQFDLKQEKNTHRDNRQLLNESCYLLRRSRKCGFGFAEKSQPSTWAGRWQGGSAAHLLQQAAEIPWDAQLPGGMCVTPICPSQKPLLLLPAPWDSVPKARWMITSNPFLLAKCFILHIATDPSLVDMSINSLTQNHVTDGPSSPQTKGRKWC